jgi:hypothetical protein
VRLEAPSIVAARLATLIRQFERDTAMLDDAVADWLGASRAELGSNDLRYEEMLRCGRLTPGEPTAAAGPWARYSAAETAALIRFFSAAHERRMERVRRIRSAMADDRPGTA